MRALLIGILLACLLWPTSARATDCAPTVAASPELERIDGETRLAFLSTRLDAAARASRIWTGSWVGIYGALTVGSLAIVPFVDRPARVEYYVSATISAIGLASLGLAPLRSIADARWFAKRPRGNVCALVADGERLLARDAVSEQASRKLWLHLSNAALNFGSLLVLGAAFHRWDAAGVQGLAGLLIGELMIVSTPQHATYSLDAYRAGRLGPSKPPPILSLAAAPLVLHQGAGVAIGGAF